MRCSHLLYPLPDLRHHRAEMVAIPVLTSVLLPAPLLGLYILLGCQAHPMFPSSGPPRLESQERAVADTIVHPAWHSVPPNTTIWTTKQLLSLQLKNKRPSVRLRGSAVNADMSRHLTTCSVANVGAISAAHNKRHRRLSLVIPRMLRLNLNLGPNRNPELKSNKPLLLLSLPQYPEYPFSWRDEHKPRLPAPYLSADQD